MNVLVTGGCGFIGSNLVRLLLAERPGWKVVNLDKLTYAGNAENLADLVGSGAYRFVRGDICNGELVAEIFRTERIDAVMHLAAESHVDRSILAPSIFIETNVRGTQVLLEAAREFGVKRFLHVSTDEVYGSLGPTGLFTETTPLDPSSPVLGLEGLERPARARVRAHLPAPGDGDPLLEQLRALPVPREAHPAHDRERGPRSAAAGLRRRHERARLDPRGGSLPGAAGRAREGRGRAGLQLRRVERAAQHRHREAGAAARREARVAHQVRDRPARARPALRHRLEQVPRALGWEPKKRFEEALGETVRWYVEHRAWWERIISGEYLKYYEKQYGDRR